MYGSDVLWCACPLLCLCGFKLADATVLARIHEYLHILCTRLARTDGLIFEEYVPVAAADQQWQPAPGSVVNFGEAARGWAELSAQ